MIKEKMEKLNDEEFEYSWTCPKCGCHVCEQEEIAPIINRKICVNCRISFQ